MPLEEINFLRLLTNTWLCCKAEFLRFFSHLPSLYKKEAILGSPVIRFFKWTVSKAVYMTSDKNFQSYKSILTKFVGLNEEKRKNLEKEFNETI